MSVLRRRVRPPYKLLSLLLQYPREELLAERPAVAGAIAALPPSPARAALERFFARFGSAPAMELQQAYVDTFDLHRRCSLYLTYGTEGDTRKRGMALLRLKRLYAAAGLPMEGSELPDYLPVMLEFAALAPEGHGRRLLADHRAGLELLRAGLRERSSPYLDLVEVICSDLPRPGAAELERLRRLAAEGPPVEVVGLQAFAPSDPPHGIRTPPPRAREEPGEVTPGMEARR